MLCSWCRGAEALLRYKGDPGAAVAGVVTQYAAEAAISLSVDETGGVHVYRT